ncbi:precorrin-8X methylmutase|nr:precorrin-8X methylmutase [Dendrosporobacter quercicolus DSM 1736]
MIIGVPAGFVGASEAKEQQMPDGRVPYIVVQGNQGGSPIAAAVVNALLYIIH